MATLEVHDDEGRVQFVELARDHPVLFGTSAACDIALSGAGICAVHGRIRWKKGRYRVEASPDAEFVLVNGHKMTSSSLHQGDEVTVGPCRLFVMRLDTDESRPAPRKPRHSDEERTKVMGGPIPHGLSGSTREAAAVRPSGPRASARPSTLEREDWLEVLELEAPRESESGTDGAGLPETYPGGSTDGQGRRHPRQGKPGAPPFLGPLRDWWQQLRDERASAPGHERIISSPLVVGLVVLLALLVVMGIGLRAIIEKTLATQQYNHAVEVMQDGDYRNAIGEFDRFLSAHAKDGRVGKARVFRELANVRQYVTISGGTWSTALQTADEMLATLGAEPEFRDERMELADLVLRIGEGLADRSRRSADEKSLQEAEQAVSLHERLAGELAPTLLKRSRLPELLAAARAAVRKARTRAEAIAAMDQSLANRSASGVYTARDALVEQYAELAQDRELVQRMTRANDLIRQAVKLDATRKSAATTEQPELLGPATSLVLRSSAEVPKSPPPAESLAYGLADGFAYALDATTGAPLWQRAVGLASPFVPQAVPGDPTVLVVDARHAELLRLDARSGRLVWRAELGEPVDGPPLVQGEQLFQVLPSGKLAVIALKSGERQAVLKLGLPLARAPVSDEQGRFLYVIGQRDCLFILAREPLSCLGVEYLGHEEGSIPCPPVRIGRFLIVVENDRPSDGRWRVLVLEEEGAKVRPVQTVNVAGWTWGTPASAGSLVWATGDRRGIEAYALGDYASKTPLRSVALLEPDADSSGPAFGLALSERELWLAAGRSGRYEVDPERGQIASKSSVSQPGPAVAPPQATPRHVVMTFRDPETGGTSLLGLESGSGSVAWQTVLGANWPTPLESAPGAEALATVGQTGHVAVLAPEALRSGGFLTLPLPRPGERRIPPGRLLRFKEGGLERAVIAAPGGLDAVWVRDPTKPEAWQRLELPATLAAMPLPWGQNLLIPGKDGRAYLIDPLTARSRAEPLVPVFDRERRGQWLAPAALDGESVVLADDAGRVRRLALKSGPVSRLVVEAETTLDKAIVADPASTGGAVIVATADQRVRVLSARDLSPIGAWPLGGPLAGQLAVVGGRCFASDAAAGVMAFDREGRRLWTITLEAPAVGTPVIRGQTIWLLDRHGRLYGRSLADGTPRERLELGFLPAAGLLGVGTQTIASVARGTVRLLPLDSVQPHQP